MNKTNESSREQAIKWWENLQTYYQFEVAYKNLKRFSNLSQLTSLTGREIEEIWLKECNQIEDKVFNNPTTKVVREAMKVVSKDVLSPKCVREGLVKPNQKQFKEFNAELFQAYIEKFDNEGLEKAKRVIDAKLFLRNLNK